jgi:hypothetical protein
VFRLILVIALGSLIYWGVSLQRSPYRTTLPMDTADLRPIQPQLAKLPSAERELVLGYLERSRGDVLPASMADPDEPFTAHTFNEAIKLQKDFLAKDAIRVAKQKEREAVREAAMEPLRAALRLSLIKREIVPRSELQGIQFFSSPSRGKAAVRNGDASQTLVSTYRLYNNTNEASIGAVKANVRIRKVGSSRYDLGDLSSCYINHNTPIPPGEGVEIRCANLNRQASDADRAYLEMPADDLVIDWEPQQIRFVNGKELLAGE